MNRRNVLWSVVVTTIASSVAGWSLLAAEPARAPRTFVSAADSRAADRPSDAKTAQIEETLRKLNLQSAELSLRLYELDMQKIDDMNQKMAGMYSNAEVDRFRTSVEMARHRVAAARESSQGSDTLAIVGVGQALLQNANDNLERDLAANRRLSTAVKPVDVERDRAAVEMAKVNVEKAKLVSQLNSPIEVLNWEIDVLRDEVRQLRWRITAITSRR